MNVQQTNLSTQQPQRTASAVSNNQNNSVPESNNATGPSPQVHQLMERVASMHDHFQNASRIQTTIEQLTSHSRSQSAMSSHVVSGIRQPSPSEQPTVRINDLQALQDTQIQVFENNGTESHQLSSVREEARINQHRDMQNENSNENNENANTNEIDEAMQENHLFQTQRMNFQEMPQDDELQPSNNSSDNDVIDLNRLRVLTSGDNGRHNLLPPSSSSALGGTQNALFQQTTTEPIIHPSILSRSPLLGPSGIAQHHLNSTSNLAGNNNSSNNNSRSRRGVAVVAQQQQNATGSREMMMQQQANSRQQQALSSSSNIVLTSTINRSNTVVDNNSDQQQQQQQNSAVSSSRGGSGGAHNNNHSNSQTQQNLQQYLARLRNIRDRQVHNSSTSFATQQNHNPEQSVPTERTVQVRPNRQSSQPDLPQLTAPSPHVQTQSHQNNEMPSLHNEQPTGQLQQQQQQIQLQQIHSRQQQLQLINTEDNPHRGTGRIIQNLLNINQAQAADSQHHGNPIIQMNSQQQQNESTQQRQSVSTSNSNVAGARAHANQALNSSSTNFTTMTSQATRVQASEYAQQSVVGGSGSNVNGRAPRVEGADRARQQHQDQTSQVLQQQQTNSIEEAMSAGSTQRERYNSTNQQQQSWPPVELYQQIDALIQQSSLQQQQAQQHEPPQPISQLPEQQNMQSSGQAQILRSILRHSSIHGSSQQQQQLSQQQQQQQQQQQPTSSSSIPVPHPIAPSNQDDLHLMAPQHSSLDDSMSMQITQQQILDSIHSNRNTTLQDTQDNNLLHGTNLRLGNAIPSNNTQRLVSSGQRRQLVAGVPNQRRQVEPADDGGAGDGVDGQSQSTMNEEQMNEIINGSRRDRAEDSSSQGSEDGAAGIRMGLAGRPRGSASGNNEDGSLPMDPSGNRNIQISTVQDQLRQRHQEILGREPRWASGAGPLESDDEFDEDVQSNLILSANRANANRIDTENSSNPSPPLASYNVNTTGQNRNSRHVLGANSRSNAVGFGVSSSDEDSNDDDESNNTSHEENMIASDPNFRRQQESNLNLRTLGIRNTSNNQAVNIEQNRQNVFNRIITSHMNREQIESGNINNRNNRAQNNESSNRLATGANGYPILDDMDLNDNDDVVSMNDSLNMLVINNTNITGNGRRQQQQEPSSQLQPSQSATNWNQNSSSQAAVMQDMQINSSSSNNNNNNMNRRDSMLRSSAIRQMREEAKSNANQNIDEIFKCFICYSKIQDAVLCPSCSKLACRDCIRKWLTEQRQQCPHCRCHLSVDRLINCRFVEEITAAIDTLNKSPPESARNGMLPDGNLLRNGNEICKDHQQRLDYFCQTCKIPICSECAMFGNAHKDHKFLRLQEVYEKHCEVIRKEAIGLKKRLKELTKYTKDVETTIEKVTKAKEEKSKEIENFNENIQHKLNTKLKNKLLTLWAQRQSMQDEIEQLEEFHNKLHLELTKMPKTSLIKKSGDLIRQLKEIHTKEPHKFIDNEVSIDFSSDIVPEYEQSVFVIKNFSRIRQSQGNQIQDDNEIVYSDPPLVTKSGLTWRLKVYPNGNGIAKGNYISVFLEMLKGLPEQQTQKYEYRVEMINHRTPSAQVVREFASEFEVGECWGYNRFYRIDLLDREGYLNTADDSITLKFFVRAPCYSQHCQDQERHITNLQKQIDNQNKEMEQLKEKLAQAQKQLKKKSTKAAKKLRAVNPSNGQQIQEEAFEDNDASIEDENSNELDDKQKSLLEFHDSHKLQNSKLNSHQYLKDLKDKQKKNDQRLNYNQQQITSIIGNRKSKPYPADQITQSQHPKNNNPFIEESKCPDYDKVASGTGSRQQLQASNVVQASAAPTSLANQDEAAIAFAQSSLATNEVEEMPSEPCKRKDEVVKLDFYQKSSNLAQVKRDVFDDEEDKQNESNDSNASNKLLVQFKQDMSNKKKYAKHNYVSEDNYDKILNDFKKNSDSANSSQKEKDEKVVIGNNIIERKTTNNKKEVMNNCHAPFKSDDESNQSDQPSLNSSSQNDEEKKEKQQYKVLKESLRQLQNRANATLANQQKLIMSNGSQNSPKEGQSKNLTNMNFAQNYSVSSGQDDDNENEQHPNHVMQDSNYDDQGISASGSDNQSSADDGQDPPYNASKFNIFGSPNVSTSNKKVPLQGAKKKTLMNNEEDDDDDDDEDGEQQVAPVDEDNEAQMILTRGASPPNVASRMVGISSLGVAGAESGGVEAPCAENSFYVQSSKDDNSQDEQLSNQEDLDGGVRMMLGESVKEPRRQFKVREPEDLGTSLSTQNAAAQDIQRQMALLQSKVDDHRARQQSSTNNGGGAILNDSIENNQGTHITKNAINDSNGKQNHHQSQSQGSSQHSNHSLKIQQLRKLAQNHQEQQSLKQSSSYVGGSSQHNKDSQISSKFNFEQIQSSAGAQGSSDGIGLSKFEESKSQHDSSSSTRQQKSELPNSQQQLQSSQKLNQINERVLEKKKLSSQISVKGLHPQLTTSGMPSHQQQQTSHNSTQLNFKKLATSNSSQLKIGNIHSSSGQSQSTKNTGGQLNIQGMNSQSQQQQQSQAQLAQQCSEGGLTTTSSNQKLLAGLNQLKQKRMLKQTMTLPNQTNQKKE